MIKNAFLLDVSLLIAFGNRATARLAHRCGQVVRAAATVVPHGHYRGRYPSQPDATALREDMRPDTPAVMNDMPVARDLLGRDRVWLCYGTAEVAMQKALAVAGATRPTEPDLRTLGYGQLVARTYRAYSDMIAARLRGR